MSDFSNFRYLVGRKDHRCEWCGEQIPEGEKHFHYTGIWEGDWQNWRMHMECHEFASGTDEISDGFSPFENERPEKKAEIPQNGK